MRGAISLAGQVVSSRFFVALAVPVFSALRWSLRRDARKRREIAPSAELHRRRMQSVQQLYGMMGHQFEHYRADLFRRQGFDASVTKGSNDQGIDAVLEKDGDRVAVHARLHRNTVPNSAVQQAYAVMAHYGAPEAWVVTPSTYSKNARELARSSGVRLVDGAELGSWLVEDHAVGQELAARLTA